MFDSGRDKEKIGDIWRDPEMKVTGGLVSILCQKGASDEKKTRIIPIMLTSIVQQGRTKRRQVVAADSDSDALT